MKQKQILILAILIFFQLFILKSFAQNKISGYVNYDNNSNSLIAFTKLYLTDSLKKTIDSAITDLTGYYVLNYVPDGKYSIALKIKYPWGGANPLDGLILSRDYIGTYTFTDPLKVNAADVNNDSKINPTDALLINKRFINTIFSFKENDWLIDNNLVTVSGQDVTHNIKVLCAGDVDSSYMPSMPLSLIFTGSGTSSTVDSVKVENITQCTYAFGKGYEVLQLNNYHTGDILKITGMSGIYKTIVMLTPTNSQTVNFNFVACTDADGNNYAVVQIGKKLWMEENIKATKYKDGSVIPNLQDSVSWRNTTAGAWCDFRNIPSEGQKYGHLYNWWAAGDSRNICPVSWHVSTDAEWLTMINYLGGVNIAGQKLKENCNTRWAYLDSTWGTNTSGFTALCTNFRNGKGATWDWSRAPNNDHDSFFWTSTEASVYAGYTNSMRWCYRDVWRCACLPKTNGAVIRCVHD